MMYTFFYTIFSIWPWRIFYGFALGIAIGLGLGTEGMNIGGVIVLWIMLMFSGWWLAFYPAKLTADLLKKVFTK